MKFADRIKALFGRGAGSNQEFFDELTDLLVEGDLGGSLAMETGDLLRTRSRASGLRNRDEILAELRKIVAGYGREISIEPDPSCLNVFLLLGVNGVGKTTTAAKLAHRFSQSLGKDRIVLAAGDTFRAAAIEQLRKHGTRLGIKVVAQEQGSDPAAVIFDALSAAIASGAGTVIADTAGRMHTRSDLLRELGKIDKVVAAKVPGARIRRLLVLDATTGQNGLVQAELFKSALPIDGLILTKFDSSARGGLVLAIGRSLGIPTAFVGTGEGYNDLHPFLLGPFLDEFVGAAP